VLLVAACGVAGEPLPEVSPALHELRLVDDHPQIPAAVFPHAEHTHVAEDGRRATCLRCHHELGDDAGAVPRACRACHAYAYLTDPVDESQPHDHAAPPDL
jgi:hypothetical protein